MATAPYIFKVPPCHGISIFNWYESMTSCGSVTSAKSARPP